MKTLIFGAEDGTGGMKVPVFENPICLKSVVNATIEA
jgi:hypothetical protein